MLLYTKNLFKIQLFSYKKSQKSLSPLQHVDAFIYIYDIHTEYTYIHTEYTYTIHAHTRSVMARGLWRFCSYTSSFLVFGCNLFILSQVLRKTKQYITTVNNYQQNFKYYISCIWKYGDYSINCNLSQRESRRNRTSLLCNVTASQSKVAQFYSKT